MTTLFLFLAAAAVTYLMRVLFVGVLPAERLPDAVKRGLTYVGPAATAAIATAALMTGSTSGSGPVTHLAAVAVAAVVALRWRNMALVVVAALAAAWAAQLILL